MSLSRENWKWTSHKAYILIFIVILDTTYPQKQTKTVETIKQMIPAPPTIRINILCDWLPISTSFTTLLLDFVFISPIAFFMEFFKSPILLVSCFPAFFSFIFLLVVVPILSLFSSSFTLLLLLFFLLSSLLRTVFFFVVSFLSDDEFTLYLHINGNFLWHLVSWTDLPAILAQSSMCPNCNAKDKSLQHTLVIPPWLGADPGFPIGVGANLRVPPTGNFAKFSPKLHEIKKILGHGGRTPKIYHWWLHC